MQKIDFDLSKSKSNENSKVDMGDNNKNGVSKSDYEKYILVSENCKYLRW